MINNNFKTCKKCVYFDFSYSNWLRSKITWHAEDSIQSVRESDKEEFQADHTLWTLPNFDHPSLI